MQAVSGPRSVRVLERGSVTVLIDFTLSLTEHVNEPGIYDVVAYAYDEAGNRLDAKKWEGLSAHRAAGMFSAFRVRVIKQYNPRVDDPPNDQQLELPF